MEMYITKLNNLSFSSHSILGVIDKEHYSQVSLKFFSLKLRLPLKGIQSKEDKISKKIISMMQKTNTSTNCIKIN